MTLRSLIAGGVIAASTVLASEAALARTNWQGEMMVTAVTNPACSNDNWGIGSNALVTYLPSGIDNNGTKSYLAFHFNRRNAYSYAVNGKVIAGATYTAVGISSAGNSFSFSGNVTQFTQSPATITTTTPFITISGQISNFSGASGCTANFQASLVLRR